ncbi:MAG: undecaprenyldiphospho-muramoylpentapeptide beta-N-acetylglucosaminyltransferase [Saprospiraceae bacterium]
MKVIISGGGTGGHIFPAIAIAQELKRRNRATEILFVGARGKLEMEKVPQAGFEIIGLDVLGFNRISIWKNFSLPVKLLKGIYQAFAVLKKFKPTIVVGVGGYASGPTLFMAQRMNIPTVLQEQNSFAGKTNKLLGKRAKSICVAYPGMEKFFPKNKIVLTGNPVRLDLNGLDHKKAEAASYFGLDMHKTTVLVMGGSLGARTLNETMASNGKIIEANPHIQWIWQYGKQGINQFQNINLGLKGQIKSMPFIDRSDLAYALADVILCRAGALTISEILITQRPAILIPSTVVAEDHQTHNANALNEAGAAILIRDVDARTLAIPRIIELLNDNELIQRMKAAQARLAKPEAADAIVNEIQRISAAAA